MRAEQEQGRAGVMGVAGRLGWHRGRAGQAGGNHLASAQQQGLLLRACGGGAPQGVYCDAPGECTPPLCPPCRLHPALNRDPFS